MKYLISTRAAMPAFRRAFCAVLPALLVSMSAGAQQLKLGNNPTRFDSSAALEIESQKLTLLLPRINDTGKIVKTVKDGSLIYFTNLPAAGVNQGLYVRSSGTWNRLSPATGTAWIVPGNSGTNGSTNFLGTTDNHPLLIKTNNLTRLFVDSTTGYTGFRTLTPAATLHNAGSTLLGVKALTNFATDAMLGTALNTVDSFTVFSIPQTTAGTVVSLPEPTDTTAGRIALLLNTGSAIFWAGSNAVNSGTAVSFVWTGTAWVANSDATTGFTVPYDYLATSSLGIMQGAAINLSAANNIAIGLNALKTNTTGTNNIAIGTGALQIATTPTKGIAIGTGAMGNSIDGDQNIAIGEGALANTSVTYGVAIGRSALAANTTGFNNVGIGASALATNETGGGNTAIGYLAMYLTGAAANDNTAMGYLAATQLTGSNNTALGASALRSIVGGSNNTAIGYSAGFTDNIDASGASVSNSTAIGAFAQITNSNTIILGSANPSYATNVGVGLYNPSYKMHVNGGVTGGTYTATSDGRLKKELRPLQQALDKIKRLRGITFNWNQEAARRLGLNTDSLNHYGFIAQEVEKILPGVVYTGSDSFHVKSIAYADIVPVLTAAVQEKQLLMDTLQKENDVIQQQLQLLQQQLDTMEKQIKAKPSRASK
jgi:hypothetical protein